MKIKLTLKSFVISASLAMVAVIIVAFSILAAVTYKPVAAFYGISEKNQEAIVSVLQRSVKTGKKSVPFKIVTLETLLSSLKSNVFLNDNPKSMLYTFASFNVIVSHPATSSPLSFA